MIIWIEDLSMVTAAPVIPAPASELTMAASMPALFNADKTAVATDGSIVVTVARRDKRPTVVPAANKRPRSVLAVMILSETALASTESAEATACS